MITKNRLGRYRFKVSKADQILPEPAEHTAEQRNWMLADQPPSGHGMVSTLAWARHWREHVGYDGPWVFFSRDVRNGSHAHGKVQAGVHRIQSFLVALVKAEARGGVEHVPYRGATGCGRWWPER